MDLNLVSIVYVVKTNPVYDHSSDLYQALRRFELFFRQACCQSEKAACSVCTLKQDCAHPAIFGQQLSSDPEIVRRHQKPSLPFAFKIYSGAENVSGIEIGLVIVGSAINHLPVFNRAVRLLIESIPLQPQGTVPELTGIYCLDYQTTRHELDVSSPDIHNLVVLSSLQIIENTADIGQLNLTFESPLRLLTAGSILHRMDLGVFLRSQMRRCSSLFAYYGEGELEIDFVGLASAADRVSCHGDGIRYLQPFWSRRPNHAGLIGTAQFRAVYPGILPLLALGSYFNAGKSASFGMGAYRVGPD